MRGAAAMYAWLRNQSGQWYLERPSGIVYSSDPKADGGKVSYRKSVGKVRAGDLIVYYRKPNLVAISRPWKTNNRHPTNGFTSKSGLVIESITG